MMSNVINLIRLRQAFQHSYASFLSREHNEFGVNIYIELFIIYFSFA